MKKRFFAAFLAFALIMGLGACGVSDQDKDPENGQKPGVEDVVGGEDTAISGSFEEIIQSMYDKTGIEMNTEFTEVTADNAEYYLGVTDIKYKRALASEPMMSSLAHSIVLLEVEEGEDIKAIKKEIKENVDGRKWVCVGVEDENILVENVGSYIMLVMDEEAQTFMDAFLDMAK